MSPTEFHHGIDGAVPADVDEGDVVAWMNSILTTVTVAVTSVGAARRASAGLRDETPNRASRVAMSGRDVH